MASSWKDLASSRLSSLKEYVISRDYKGTYENVAARVGNLKTATVSIGSPRLKSWEDWMAERKQRRAEEMKGTEKVALFPGWATRKYKTAQDEVNGTSEFMVEVFVSGYAYSLRPPDQATRAQRTFMKIAKGLANLPKLPPAIAGETPAPWIEDKQAFTKSEEDLIKTLPPPPSEMPEDPKVDTYATLRSNGLIVDKPAEGGATPSSAATGPPLPARRSSVASTISSSTAQSNPWADVPPAELAQLYANLDTRLQLFWANILANREVRVTLFTAHDHGYEEPIASAKVLTTDQGYYQQRFIVPYDYLAGHSKAAHIVFGARLEEHDIIVKAELLPFRPPNYTSTGATTSTTIHHPVDSALDPSTSMSTRLSTSNVRLISDIDDTVKTSQIPLGARTVLRNVFVKPLEEVVIPDMSQWYRQMETRGVRFHYVSASPFQLLQPLNDFFDVGRYPLGSLMLKYYGGRSVFQGVWEPAGERKRPRVLDVLNSFPTSKFFCVGDTGEQDLELYTSVAKEFAAVGRNQIVAIFIRNVSVPPPASVAGTALPASWPHQSANRPSQPIPPQLVKAQTTMPPTSQYQSSSTVAGGPPPIPPHPPVRAATEPPIPLHYPSGYFDSEPHFAPSPGSTPQMPGSDPVNEPKTELERKTEELRVRVEKARAGLPPGVLLRIFWEPTENVEAEELLNLMMGRSS